MADPMLSVSGQTGAELVTRWTYNFNRRNWRDVRTAITADPAIGDLTDEPPDARESFHCDATGGAFSVTLPTAADNAGRRLFFVKTDASANAVTLDGEGSETINGATTLALSSQWDKAELECDGSGWVIVST